MFEAVVDRKPVLGGLQLTKEQDQRHMVAVAYAPYLVTLANMVMPGGWLENTRAHTHTHTHRKQCLGITKPFTEPQRACRMSSILCASWAQVLS